MRGERVLKSIADNKLGVILIIWLLIKPLCVVAQIPLNGTVVDAATNEPLAFATIYLNNTSIGANSDKLGNFQFQIPAGEHEVIVQFIGYQSISFQIDTDNLAASYKCKMFTETKELASVKITGERDKEWYENLKTFKKNFLGSSENALKCEILNEKALVIDFDANSFVLSVYANEPLLIDNPALGYTLQYSLIEFTYHMQQGQIFFAGYPFFKINESSKRQIKKIGKSRKRAYEGSLPHLIKSLLSDKVEEQGFRIMRLYRMPNPARPADSVIQSARKMFLFDNLSREVKDSLRTNILSKSALPRTVAMLDTTALHAADLITVDDNGIYLETETLLQIVYTREKEELNYLLSSKEKKRGPQTSIVHLVRGKEKLNPLGDISDPSNILVEGYMAWEKVGDLMPLDYHVDH